jgi:hypothetical protein
MYASRNDTLLITLRRMGWMGMGQKRGAHRILVEIPEGKRPL